MRFLMILLLTFFLPLWAETSEVKHYTQVKIADTTVHASISATSAEKIRGLQGVKSLGADDGMLFIYHHPKILKHWMKDMFISLDMIWIDSDKKIINISANAMPCVSEPCQIYSSETRAKYVLEVNAGFAKAHHITPGLPVVFAA